MRKSVALVVALVALLSGLLGGCAQSPGTAAKVGDAVITEGRLDDLAARAASASGMAAGDLRPALMNLAIRADLAHALQRNRPDLTVDAADRDQLLAEYAPFVMADPQLRPLAEAESDLRLMAQQLGADGLRTATAATPVEVNPRYGRWDGQAFALAQANQSLARQWTPDR